MGVPPDLLPLFHFWNSYVSKIWKDYLYATFWSIWLCRNESVFKNKVWELDEDIDVIKTRMAIWIKGKFGVKDYSIDDFKRCLNGIRKVRI